MFIYFYFSFETYFRVTYAGALSFDGNELETQKKMKKINKMPVHEQRNELNRQQKNAIPFSSAHVHHVCTRRMMGSENGT